MSERPDWSECLYRPNMLCGENAKFEHGPADMRELWHMTEAQPPPQLQPQSGQPPLEAPPAEAPIPTPMPEPTLPEVPIRHKGLIFSSYWLAVSDVYAGVGDVVVVKNASDYVIIRRVPKSNHWVDDTLLRIAGYVERRLCIYGFVLSRDIERIAAELRSGRFALVAACDPRAVVRPPRREELYSIWRYEGYLTNAAPAKMALVRLDPTRKPKFAVDFLKKGCPIYSQHLNQILQLSGIPIQLTC
ncbi:MAG: hypothetical protein ACO2PN_14765 [Pyrobaculum sp.]|jgi:hypothetical protein